MKKIPTIFKRDPNDRAHVTQEVNPECQWVFDGEGVATRKFDGTCMKKDQNGMWWARREVKLGKVIPPHYITEQYDDVTGKSVGWVPIEDSPFYKFWQEAVSGNVTFWPGTYELIGPKINGNPEKVSYPILIPHGYFLFDYPEKSPSDLIDFCREKSYEGIVWHHPDGRMAKLKVRDFK